MLARLADRLILKPSRRPISTDGKQLRQIDCSGGRIDVWSRRCGPGPDREPGLFVLKFPGAGGRAERANDHPADCWSDATVEVWAVNPPGYGGSSGRASVRHLAPAARNVFESLRQVAGSRPVLVTGNSLGAATALALAASRPVDGLLLRNPPPLRELIVGRHGWWNFGYGAKLIADQVPAELCSIRNAARCRAPVVFVMSAEDRVVPPSYQHQVIDAYAGESRLLVVPGADHACPIQAEQSDEYLALLQWLRERTFERSRL